MPARPILTNTGETRSDLIFVRLSPTEKAHLKQMQEESAADSMSSFIRWVLNSYYEVSHRKAS